MLNNFFSLRFVLLLTKGQFTTRITMKFYYSLRDIHTTIYNDITAIFKKIFPSL